MTDRAYTKLGDLASDEPGSIAIGPFGSRMKSEVYVKEGVPVIRGTNISDGRQLTGDWVYVSEEFARGIQNCIVEPGDLVFPHRGSIGQVAIIRPEHRKIVLSTSMMKFRADRRQANSAFLYYYFRSSAGRNEILNYSSQVGTPGIGQPLTSLRQFRVPTIDISTQNAIAGVLGILDDKIELNRQLNNTLEAMALAIFKSWFIDFDPVRAKMAGRDTGLAPELAALFPDSLADSEFGKVPNGWSFSTIGAETEVVGGNTPSTKDSCFWDGTFAFATPKDLSGLDSPFLLNTERRLTKEGVERVSSGVLPVDTVLMSSRAPIGYVAIARIPVSINQGFAGIKCIRTIGPIFTYFWAKFSKTIIEGRASGSTFLEISKGAFREVEVLRPDETLLSAFEKVATPLFDRIESGVRESATLAALRDFLLPKLMSGEIRVEDAEKLAGEAGV